MKMLLFACRIILIDCFFCTRHDVLFEENFNVNIGTEELDSAGGTVLVWFGTLVVEMVKCELVGAIYRLKGARVSTKVLKAMQGALSITGKHTGIVLLMS